MSAPKLNWAVWFYGLWVAVIGGGASAVTSTFAVSMHDPGKYNLAGGLGEVLRLMLTIFAINAIFLFFAYLGKHPAPEWDGVDNRRSAREIAEMGAKQEPEQGQGTSAGK